MAKIHNVGSLTIKLHGLPELNKALKVAKELAAVLADVEARMKRLGMADRMEFGRPFLRPRKRRSRT